MSNSGETYPFPLFRCPACKHPLASPDIHVNQTCEKCGWFIKISEGIPLLINDCSKVTAAIEEAKNAGRAIWYEAPQLRQWNGPYRHHLKKRQQYVESVLDAFKNKNPDSFLRGLDLGCGDGGNIIWLRRHFDFLYASDYNLLRLTRAARAETGANVFMADVTDYPVVDNSFDVIFFNHVLEHISNDDAALKEVFRILKPGGLLILGVPNEGVFFWKLAYKLQPKIRATSDHLHLYTAASIAEKCQQAGFIVKEVHPIGWGVPHWTLDAVIRRWKWVDDLLEMVGRRWLPSQATSLYVILSKQ